MTKELGEFFGWLVVALIFALIYAVYLIENLEARVKALEKERER